MTIQYIFTQQIEKEQVCHIHKSNYHYPSR